MTMEEILSGESKNVEYKVQRPDRSIKYMKTVVAFANGKGGQIIFGIDDKTREVVGIPENNIFQEIDAITNAISDSCEPTIIPDVYLQNIDDKTVIIAKISAGRQKPYYVKSEGLDNGVYIRVSGTTRRADREMSKELYYECDARSFDSVIRRDLSVSDEEIEKLCKEMKEVAIANSKSNMQRSQIKNITKNVLLSWGILKKDENNKIHPTNAYVYLTGQDGMRSMIQCAVFKGTTRCVFLDRRNYDGPLWEQVDETAKFVLRNIRMGCKYQGVYRQDIYELPPDGIRELIVNAVMNCSYIQTSNIQVALYDDRLEITSPGSLLTGVTIDLMKEGFSKIRNKALAKAFSYMNLVEAWGSGIPKLMSAMKKYGLREPEFIDMDVAFRINLYRGYDEANNTIGVNDVKNINKVPDTGDGVPDTSNKVPDTGDGVPDTSDRVPDIGDGVPDTSNKVPDNRRQTAGKMPTNDQEQQIYKFVLKNVGITTAQAMELLGIKQRRTREILANMVENGWLRKEGAARSTIYIKNKEMK